MRRSPLRRPLGSLALALLLALGMGAALASMAPPPVAQASGSGQCDPIGPSQLSQPEVAPVGGATLTLDRSQGIVGTLVTLSGANWPANSGVSVAIYVNVGGSMRVAGANVAGGPTSSTGQIPPIQMRAPEPSNCDNISAFDSPGGMVLFVARAFDGQATIQAQALFTYLPAPRLQPTLSPFYSATATGGQPIALVGSGWGPGETITLSTSLAPFTSSGAAQVYSAYDQFKPDPATVVHVTVAASGTFSILYRLPQVTRVTEAQITLATSDARLGDVQEPWPGGLALLPPHLPAITLDKASASDGGAVTITGAHWLPKTAVTLQFCHGRNQVAQAAGLRCYLGDIATLGTVTSDAAGHFTATVRLPANAAPGPATIQAIIPDAPLNLRVYAQGQAFSVTPTFAQAHPRLTRALGAWPWFTGALAAILAIAGYALLRRARPSRSADGLHVESLSQREGMR